MAQDNEKTRGQMLDELFQAIDVITSKRLEHLQFNKTLTCKIINTDNSDKGEYIVTDGSTDFVAYSENPNYNENTWVYVLIPNSDFNQQKIITGKYVADNTEYSTYVNPLDTYIDITGNLLNINSEQTYGLIANNTNQKEIVLWQTGDISLEPHTFRGTEVNILDKDVSETTQQLSKYDRLGIQANFKTLLNKYNIVSGHYGLRLDIVSMDPGSMSTSTTNLFTNLRLDSDDMFGNPYNFILWSQQQYVFDISNIDNIVGMRLVFYQSNDFVNNDKILIPGYSQPEEWEAYLSMANILVKNIYISLGYDLNDFDEDSTFLYTFEPLTYASYLTEEAREVLANIYHKDNLNTTEEVAEGLTIVNQKNLHLRWVHINENNSITAIDNINDVDTWRWNREYPIANVHWYRWKLEDGVEDPLAGAFWEKQILLENQFNWNNFNPNPLVSREKIKTIIEYPSLMYLEYQYREGLDEDIISLIETAFKDLDEEIDDIDNYTENLQSYQNHIILVSNAIMSRVNAPTNYFDYQKLFNENFNEEDIEYPNEVDSEKWQLILNEVENYHISYLNQCMLYESDILELTNEHAVVDSTAVELIRGLQIVCDKKNHNGIYRLYNSDGKIMNMSESYLPRILTAEFDTLITGDHILDKAEVIRWYFPINNTMIEYPVEGNEYILDDETNTKFATFAGELDSHDWFCIERQGVQFADRDPGDIVPTELEQIFRIKNYYTQTAVNNTIKCEVYKNNKTYVADVTLYFGTHGTNGTDYTLTITYEEYKNNNWVPMVAPVFDWQKGPIKLVPHVFDYEDNEITDEYDDSDFSATFYSKPSIQALVIEKDGKEFIISHENEDNKSIDPATYYHYIVKITVQDAVTVISATDITDENEIISANDTATELSVDLTAYCPIAVRFDETYFALDGDNRILYDTSGVNPIYYKGQYSIYKIENNQLVKQPVQWSMQIEDTATSLKFYPQIDATTGELVVPSMFMSGNKPQVSILAKVNGRTIWCQPLHIYQEVYASAMLNSWDGSLTIDEENGTIMSAMVGAGYKDSTNRFNGVLMGNVGKKIGISSTNTQTGLFGYHEGAQSFGLKIDGTAFFGKSGHGQILLNGNTGEIKSASWRKFSTDNLYMNGMHIDLDNAQIDLEGNQFNDPDGQTDLSGNIIKRQTKIHLGVSGNLGDPYFQIQDNLNSTNVIFFSNGTQYIQSSDYNPSNRTGVRFDLTRGNLTGYDFSLIALADDNTGVKLSSAGTPYYLNVIAKNSKTNRNVDVLMISKDEFVLRSIDFDPGKAGTELNIKTGQIRSSNFYLYANAPNVIDITRALIINSNDDTYPLSIYQSTEHANPFRIKWDGSLEALQLEIDQIHITSSGIFLNGLPGSSGTYTGLALWQNPSETNRITLGHVTFNSVSTTDVWYERQYDEEGNESIIRRTYTYEQPSGIVSGTSGFYVTSTGSIQATRGDFGTSYIGNLYIYGGLIYKNQIYSKYQANVVTSVQLKSLSVKATYSKYNGIVNSSTSSHKLLNLSCYVSGNATDGYTLQKYDTTVYDHIYSDGGYSTANCSVSASGSVKTTQQTLTYLGRAD